jgi:hypothetical protein
MIDIKRSFYSWSDSQQIATGFEVSEEGQGLIAVMEDGVEKVKPCDGAAGTFVGFAMFRQQDFSTAAVVEEHVVPTAAPYVVELGKSNLIGTVGALGAQIRVYDETNGVELTEVLASADGAFVVDIVGGKVTFNVAQAGVSVKVYYRYNLTVAEAKLNFYEAPTNHPNPNFFTQVGVGKGKGRVYTMYYDQTIDWSAPAAGALKASEAAGMITDSTGTGVSIPNSRVVSVPTPSDPYLGIEFLV